MCGRIVRIVNLPFSGLVVLSPGKIIDPVPMVENGDHLREGIAVCIDTYLIQIWIAVHKTLQQGDIIPVKLYIILGFDLFMRFQAKQHIL